ncbi:MAG TPA: hypothetical protein VFC15_17480 [Candidatus Limnocylindrales bacterium]|jgi:hypothetical protein|nr:hypothetical protein [Candidatus Limnocylindrales bacterium]
MRQQSLGAKSATQGFPMQEMMKKDVSSLRSTAAGEEAFRQHVD